MIIGGEGGTERSSDSASSSSSRALDYQISRCAAGGAGFYLGNPRGESSRNQDVSIRRASQRPTMGADISDKGRERKNSLFFGVRLLIRVLKKMKFLRVGKKRLKRICTYFVFLRLVKRLVAINHGEI